VSESIDLPEGHGKQDIYQAISSSRRRWIIHYLAEHGRATKSDLADGLAEHEFGARYDSSDRKTVYVSIHQAHEDVLGACGLIDVTGDVFRATDLTRSVSSWLRNGPDGNGKSSILGRLFP
jgi:hypothetical protein